MNADPKVPRPAATVVLTREEGGRLSIYLLKRSLKSGFMPGSYVFPGGTVDTADRERDFWVRHVDLGMGEISERWGGDLPASDALAYGVAAARETFEEAGILFCGENGGAPSALQGLLHRRGSNRMERGWFAEAVRQEGLKIGLSALAPWSHWITPALRSTRFDTRFFFASMPMGQECIPDSRETTHGIWAGPEEALAGNLRGEIPLSPPTLVTLHELLPFQDAAGLKREGMSRWGETRRPRLILSDQSVFLLLPWDPFYAREKEAFPTGSKSPALPVGEPFSRLRLEGGIWRPVGA